MTPRGDSSRRGTTKAERARETPEEKEERKRAVPWARRSEVTEVGLLRDDILSCFLFLCFLLVKGEVNVLGGSKVW
jgi:hypothetical protein